MAQIVFAGLSILFIFINYWVQNNVISNLFAIKPNNVNITDNQRAVEEVNEPELNATLGVMYVEVNNNNFLNVGCYTVNDEPLFDIAIIFAANINYDVAEQRAILHFNENVARVLENAEEFIRPIQAKGIKVLLSILGNHDGVGICNFPTQEAARDFAVQLNSAVERYGLDGIDFDDEYADYGKNNETGNPNLFSFVYLLKELRSLMPNKIISFYYYGPAKHRLSYNGINAGDYLDYSWNAMYGMFSPPKVPGLDKSRLAPAATWVNRTTAKQAQAMATRTVNKGYGVYLYYDLRDTDVNNYLSGISDRLYGQNSTLSNGCLASWRPKNPNATENIEIPQAYLLPLREFNRR